MLHEDVAWDLAVMEDGLKAIGKIIRRWRAGFKDTSDFDYLYAIEEIIDEVGLE